MQHRHVFRCDDCGFEIGHSCAVSKVDDDMGSTVPRVAKHAEPEATGSGRNERAIRAVRRCVSPASARRAARVVVANTTTNVVSSSIEDTKRKNSEYIPDISGKNGVVHRNSESLIETTGTDTEEYRIHEMRKTPKNAKNGVAAQLSFVAPIEPEQPAVPDKLAEFDRIMRRAKKYRPTAKFYERVMERYGDIPYLDFAEQADAAIDWLRSHRKRYDEMTDICRFMERWFVRAAEDAGKVARANGVYRRPKPAPNAAQSLRMGGGLSASQDPAIERMEREARRHYE